LKAHCRNRAFQADQHAITQTKPTPEDGPKASNVSIELFWHQNSHEIAALSIVTTTFYNSSNGDRLGVLSHAAFDWRIAELEAKLANPPRTPDNSRCRRRRRARSQTC
jgi:hypothetical protein